MVRNDKFFSLCLRVSAVIFILFTAVNAEFAEEKLDIVYGVADAYNN